MEDPWAGRLVSVLVLKGLCHQAGKDSWCIAIPNEEELN